jgi:two-component system, cell cycle sensor histidine kinase PleC
VPISTARPAPAVRNSERMVPSATDASALARAELLATVLDGMANPVFVKDPSRRLVFCNDAFCAAIRRPRAALLGRTDEQLLAADEARAFRAVDDRVFSTGEAEENGEAFTDANGKRHWIVTRKSIITLHGERYVLGVITDMTRRKEAEERLAASERELARAKSQLVDSIEALPAGFVLYDAEDRLVLSNSTYTRLYGGNVDPPGTRFEDALRISLARGAYPGAIGREEEWLAERMAARREARGSFEQQLTNGHWLRVVERRTSDGGTVGIRIDITESKEAELALRRAKEAAEAANRTKTEFLANMSHELRTPLNAIIGFAEALGMGVIGGELKPQQRAYLDDIHRSGLHLLALINDVLDVARIDAGHLALREDAVDVAELVEACDRLLRSRADEAEVALACTRPGELPVLNADPLRLKQILLNLLSNAIKFTPAGGQVSLAVTHDPTNVSFRVADTGIGMHAHEIPVALQPFRQVDGSLSRKHDGAGLGLPLAKRLAELHGGTLAITSTPGRGTEVVVTLPKTRTA